MGEACAGAHHAGQTRGASVRPAAVGWLEPVCFVRARFVIPVSLLLLRWLELTEQRSNRRAPCATGSSFAYRRPPTRVVRTPRESAPLRPGPGGIPLARSRGAGLRARRAGKMARYGVRLSVRCVGPHPTPVSPRSAAIFQTSRVGSLAVGWRRDHAQLEHALMPKPRDVGPGNDADGIGAVNPNPGSRLRYRSARLRGDAARRGASVRSDFKLTILGRVLPGLA